MKFDDFDKKMRFYEESLDQIIPTDCYMVARLDGNNFTKLTKQTLDLQKPFDIRFRKAIVETIEYLMTSHFQILYAYNESDEISLLFNKNADKFKRKVRKYNSLLAAETSVKFTQQIGTPGIFDCRMIALPTVEDVLDYFVWRQEDCRRNSINSYCYYSLISMGKIPREAADTLKKISFEEKTTLLRALGVNIKTLDKWKTHGTGLYWKTVLKEGYNPITRKSVWVHRPKAIADYNLPAGIKYKEMIKKLLAEEL